MRKLEISFIFTMVEINLTSTDGNLIIYQTRNRLFHSGLERKKKNEVTETKSFELLRKTELHQFEVLLIPHLALSDDETKPRVP